MIDRHKLPPEGLRLTGALQELALEGEDRVLDAAFEVFLLPSGQDLFIDVKGTGAWQGACSRCLAPLDRPLAVTAQYLASPDPDLARRGEHTLGSQDLDVVFLPEAELDEADLAREQFELQAPGHPLCQEDCKGLCPVCGKNWNKGPCACPSEALKPEGALARALKGVRLDLEP
ncbi:MAG TPA: DUF177 domain-containing protein [Holophagaceae bacterium]|nr:DUF177 domain-containing protein [Holophagaceae bacterium]